MLNLYLATLEVLLVIYRYDIKVNIVCVHSDFNTVKECSERSI